MKYCNDLNQTSPKSSEVGATLLVTMVVLLLISMVAVMAFRQSDNDLSLSTSAQVRNVLFQSSDMGLAILESEARKGKLVGDNALIPYIKSMSRVGNEVVFCIRPRQTSFFDSTKISEKLVYGGYIIDSPRGYCNPDQTGTDSDFTSARETTMLQMTIEKEKLDANGEAFRYHKPLTKFGVNQKDAEKDLDPVPFKATSHAVLPAFSEANESDVYDCMKKSVKIGTTDDFSEKCLKDLKVPQKYTEQSYVYMYVAPPSESGSASSGGETTGGSSNGTAGNGTSGGGTATGG